MTEEDIQEFKPEPIEEKQTLGAVTMSLDQKGSQVLIGDSDGTVSAYSLEGGELSQVYTAGSAITDVLWDESRAVASSSKGMVHINDHQLSQHAGKATALALHPSGSILASVGEDKSIVFYDVQSAQVATQIFTDAGEFKIPTWRSSMLTTS